MTNWNTVEDPEVHACYLAEKARILAERRQQQNTPAPNNIGSYFTDISGDGSDLPKY